VKGKRTKQETGYNAPLGKRITPSSTGNAPQNVFKFTQSSIPCYFQYIFSGIFSQEVLGDNTLPLPFPPFHCYPFGVKTVQGF